MIYILGFGRVPAELGPETRSNGSGSTNGPERTQHQHRRLILRPFRDQASGPEIVDFWSLDGLLPQNLLEKVGVLRPPPFPVGFAVGGGRLDPKNKGFAAQKQGLNGIQRRPRHKARYIESKPLPRPGELEK